jgi:hypothetical protein
MPAMPAAVVPAAAAIPATCRSRATRHERNAKRGDGQQYAIAFHSILLFDALFCGGARTFRAPLPFNAFVFLRNKARAERQSPKNVPWYYSRVYQVDIKS